MASCRQTHNVIYHVEIMERGPIGPNLSNSLRSWCVEAAKLRLNEAVEMRRLKWRTCRVELAA